MSPVGMILSAALKIFVSPMVCLAQIKKQRYGAPLSLVSVPELHRCRLKREFTTLLTNHVDGTWIRALAQHTNHSARHSVAASPWFLISKNRLLFLPHLSVEA